MMGMRSIPSRPAYVELLDCLARAVVGRKVYVDNRMTKPLSEWFTLTDEAFLLLCLESYVPKWNREWAQSSRAPIAAAAAAERQQEGEQKEGDGEDALYTGRSRGTKRSWSKDGLERFNGLMIDVYRQANGANFDNIFREEMIKRYGKQNDSANPARGGEDEQANPENRVVVVYSDFNMEQLMAHATAASAVGAGREATRGGQQEQGNDDDDSHTEEVGRVMV
ncbi:hypothetical protein MHU86_8825 [Fragilaria crotonensis]|nr:hypothetical protein MHU86_8825 [Fragilaria crotonensis]